MNDIDLVSHIPYVVGIGTLLLLSLFKERLGLDGAAPAGNGAPGNGSKVVAK